MGEDQELPGICKNCQQWLCATKDLFCAFCGMGVVVAHPSSEKIELRAPDYYSSFLLNNTGLFRLYWAAEIISPESTTRNLFTIEPDYGILNAGEMQTINISLNAQQQFMRAHLEIASNDPRHPEMKIELSIN